MRNLFVGLLMVVGLMVLGACALTVKGNPVVPSATSLSATPEGNATVPSATGLSATPEGNATVPSATSLSATLQIPASLPDGDTVKIQFTLTNDSEVDLYVLKWYTPLEGIGGEIFRVKRDGQAVPYTGILAMRGDRTPRGYVLLAAGQSASAEVDLAEAFDFSRPGEYTIEFLPPRISHVARAKAEMARSLDDLGPVAIPSNTVTVKVGRSSAEPTPAPTEESANEQAFGEPGPPPDGWERYTSTRWGVSFAVPAVWQEEGADHFVGEDGFARLERFAGPGLSVDQACEWEANSHRERYGPEPGLQSLAWKNAIHVKGFPCLILGSLSDTSEFQSAILLPNPREDHRSRFLILRMDTAHAETVARSLSYRLHVPPQPTLSGNSYLATPRPEGVPDDLPLQTSHFDELTLEEYAVIDARVDSPGHLEFFQRIPPAVLEKRRAWRGVEAIEPYRGPVEVGGERVTVKKVPYGKFQRHGGVGSSMYVSVQKDGTEVYRYNMLMHAGSFPLYFLGNWDGQWVLEANGMLIVDGKIVNQDWGYDEIFGAQLLNEKPFYFFVQDGETRAVYDGQVLSVAYNYVFHGMCCEPGVFNVAGNSQMVWFYALRNGVWHYVELGVYD